MKHVCDIEKQLAKRCQARPPFVFLDYDGTLTPIVRDPPKAVLSRSSKKFLK